MLACVPENRSNGQRIFGMKRRNLIEAIVFTVIFCFIICICPFILRAKIIFCLTIGGVIFVFCIIGIRNRSVTETLQRFVAHKMNKRALSFRKVTDEQNKSRIKKIQKRGISNYFDDENLYAEEDADFKKTAARFVKDFVSNITDNVGRGD